MTVQVKICGLTNLDDAMDAVELGADLLGFNFYPDSKRFIKPMDYIKIAREIPNNVQKVGVFVNADQKLVTDFAIEGELDFLQFHGDESAEYCNSFARPYIKALRPKSEKDLDVLKDYEADFFLIDSNVSGTYGGSGVTANWDLARKAKEQGKSIFLAGGLKSDNIEMAIASVKPYGVDVSSGVELRDGKKDYHEMDEFIKKAKFFGK